jgi:eukaryotic-like serine/threonine-protein kinase
VVAKREKEGWLDVNSIDNFPCVDLRTIDQLWVKYSNGRFGFSIQKRIYQSLGGTREYDWEIWEAFGDKVGWRKGGRWLYYKDITFDIKAPEAHLPALSVGLGVVKWCMLKGGGVGLSSLASRLVKCNI